MNIIRKGGFGTINEIKKRFRKFRTEEDLHFDVDRMNRDVLKRMLVVAGRVGKDKIAQYETKAKQLGSDFRVEKRRSWVFTQKTIMENYDPSFHKGVLLIGSNKELPATQISYQNTYAFTDWFMQDLDGDSIPDTPIGRIFGPTETVLYHMDPFIIDSNIAVVFDSQPKRSDRYVKGLTALGFDVEVLNRFTESETNLLAVSEFILQLSDGVFTSRIHGTPERWATHNSVILSHDQAAGIKFEGYPVVFSEACRTAQEGPLLKAFLNQGACYIGATLDTLNNMEPFNDWRMCPYCDGWKFGFLDELDSHELIGEVKIAVDRALTENLDSKVLTELDNVRKGETTTLTQDQAVSVVEWVLFGNPLRNTTVGPDAKYTPGRIVADT
ncbi:MAG: hypothetical protein E3J86_03185 [Candidatus Thorarchaeota archaeon]|nr:MAG: hypothetical protein E3J86_03185 [Candidatus Thorarchaeota archaeon]